MRSRSDRLSRPDRTLRLHAGKAAEVIGKSRSHLANTLRLLKLPPYVIELVRTGKLTSGHGRALVGRDDAELLAERIVAQDLSVREAEALVQPGAAVAETAIIPRKDTARRTPIQSLRKGAVGHSRIEGRDQARVGRERADDDQVRELRPTRLHQDADRRPIRNLMVTGRQQNGTRPGHQTGLFFLCAVRSKTNRWHQRVE